MSRAIQRITLIMSSLAVIVFLTLGFTSQGQHLVDSYGPSLPSFPNARLESSLNASTSAGKSTDAGKKSQDTHAGVQAMNAAAKAELGRHAWYLFHTVLSQYPDQPSANDAAELQEWIKVFTRQYPCKSCSSHFTTLLQALPVQTSSRVAAAMWGCTIHNRVNKDLGKRQHDCSTVLEDYDCGCGEPAR